MSDLDSTFSSAGKPVTRFTSGFADLWRFLTRPASADFRRDTTSIEPDVDPRDDDDKVHGARDRDKVHPLGDGFNLHHF
jgi:hypothetical protein